VKITHEFTVHTPIDKAWAVLTDLEGIAPCLPGAQLTGVDGDVYSGKVKVKVGPVISDFNGTARFVEKDDTAHRAVIDAKGRDARSAGNAAALITAELRPSGDATVVSVDTDLKISGKLAQFGSGMIKEVSGKLLGQFVAALEAKIGAAPATPAPDTPAGSSTISLSGSATSFGAGSPAGGAPDGSGLVGGDDLDTSIAVESPGGAATAFATDVHPAVAATPEVGGPAAGVDAGPATGGSGTGGTTTDASTESVTGGSTAGKAAADIAAGTGTRLGTDPAATSDATLGAGVTSGPGVDTEASVAAPTRIGTPAARNHPEPEPLDLMELAGGSIRKRLAPFVIGAAAVIAAVVVVRIVRR
jgi:carbon monoxide dehydrogenase subunit G